MSIVTLGVLVAVNIIKNREWHEDLGTMFSWHISNVITGIASLCTGSYEERMYEKYLAAKQAMHNNFLKETV